MHSSCFSKAVHDLTPRFPPPAPAGGSSPASSVLPRRYDFLPSIPPCFVTFAWRYLSLHSLFSLPGGRVPHQGLELVKPGVSSREILLRKRQDLASSWGISIVHSRMFSRRRQDGCTRPLRCSRVAPGMRKAEAPTKGLSTLNSMAFGLAVYASQCGLPTPHARLASGRWSGATGRAFHPQGSDEGFQICFLHLFLPSQVFLAQSMKPKRGMLREITFWKGIYFAAGSHFSNHATISFRISGKYSWPVFL